MAAIIPALPTLTGELTLFYTTDPLLGNSPVLVFHGPATTIGATSSRIQVHVFTPAGLGSYARVSVSPTSPFYSAVSNLPREEQGDEVCRGLAFGLKRYFAELPDHIKTAWCARMKAASPTALFGDHHVAILATRMNRISNVDDVIKDLAQGFGEQRLSWSAIDVVLPAGSIRELSEHPDNEEGETFVDDDILKQKFGRYAELIASFGPCAFLPTSKLKRAPSKATAIGRSTSFLRNQKESVRRELSELVATEESYVTRLGDIQAIATELRSNANAVVLAQLDEIFPASLAQILEVNRKFLISLRETIASTEAEAVADLESTSEEQASASQHRQVAVQDAQGISAIAKCLCEWFPQLASSYHEYMTKHIDASTSMRAAIRNTDALALAMQGFGEQRLTSLLIEPVQRLPRYNLYIDSISKQLPVRHPALKSLLKARDIITGICAEAEGPGAASMMRKLASRTVAWPTDLQLAGRIVAAVDYTELVPPYGLNDVDGGAKLLILFTDSVIFLERAPNSTTSARTLLTELESGSLPTYTSKTGQEAGHDLTFLRHARLEVLRFTESHEGHALQLLTFCQSKVGTEAGDNTALESYEVLKLGGSYDGKAFRFIEDFCKAEVESRFSEAERLCSKWEFRATDPLPDHVGLFSAIFENSDPSHIKSRAGNAAVRVIIDIDRHSDRPRAGHNGIRSVIAISPTRDGLWRVTVDALDGSFNREHLGTDEIVPSLRRKLAALLASRLAIDQSAMTDYLLDRNFDILRSIDLHTQNDPNDAAQAPTAVSRERARSKSPRKLISSFLSSVGSTTEPTAVLRRDVPTLPAPSHIPRAAAAPSKPPSRESRPPSRDLSIARSVVPTQLTDAPASTSKKLEETLSSFVLALQARKGNIVGRNIKMRKQADELAVNELYNSLLEDPTTMVLAAQAAVDVLFAAFEKFLNIAWAEHFGQLMPGSVMMDIQTKAESLFPVDFDRHVRTVLAQLPAPNQRAFKVVMNLLADLLDGTGNDSDRGTLTAAFAEVLVPEGNPHDYIALIDRFVDDSDTYFGEPLVEVQKQPDTDATNHHKRSRSVNSASVNSNHSSLRKKFGFGALSRENSKAEPESKMGSVWRTLSKSTRIDDRPGNATARESHARHVSVEAGSQGFSSRPTSQDGGKSIAFSEGNSSASLGLTTIGEHPSFIPTGPPRKKRRSSLSDLKPLEASPDRGMWSPPSVRRSALLDERLDGNSSIPSTPSSRGNSIRMHTPSRMPRPQLPSSFCREPSPAASQALNNSELRPKSSGGRADEVIITARPSAHVPALNVKPASPTKHASSPLGLSRNGLAERPGAGNIMKRLSPGPDKAISQAAAGPSTTDILSPPTRKLRMQSPQKLRERLQHEAASVAAAHSTLQDELNRIGDQLTATPSRMSSVRSSRPGIPASRSPAAAASSMGNMDLAQRVLKLEGQLPLQIQELEQRLTGIQADVASSLSVSETKCKKLDELYREANGENEALYGRFNDELSRILKAVRGGDGVEELKRQLRESQEETAKLRRETSRLKRENAGLRAQLRE